MNEQPNRDGDAALDGLLAALPAQFAAPAGARARVEARLRSRLPDAVSRRRLLPRPPRLAWRFAAAPLVLLLLVTGGLAASPAARAQLLRFACYIPGFGIQTCDTQALITPHAVSATANGTTVTVTQLLSGARGATLHLEVNRADGVAALGSALGKTTVQLRDDRGQTYVPTRRFAAGNPLENLWTGVTYDLNIPFPALAADARSVQVVVTGPAPIGTLTLTVPVLPTALAGLPPAAPGGAAVTQLGVTLRVGAVFADRTRTEVQLVAQAAPSVGKVVGIADAGIDIQNGPERAARPIVLTDDQGHTYGEIPSPAAPLPTGTATPGAYVDDVVFPPLPAGAHPVTLTVPYMVVAEQLGERQIMVPVAGVAVGQSIPFQATLPLGPYTVRVTGASISPNGCDGPQPPSPCQPVLTLRLDLGGWQKGRELMQVLPALVDGKPAGFTILDWGDQAAGDGPPQWKAISAPLPAQHGDHITITLRGGLIAVAGPWRLSIPAAMPAGG